MKSLMICNLFSIFSGVATARALLTPQLNDIPSNLLSRATSKAAFRILPIGDCITWGYGSTDGNGYRERLKNLLVNNTVNYIGSQHSGSMANNNNEGYPGKEIAPIGTLVKGSGSLAQRPNLVLIMAGTNDIKNNDESSTAPQRLGALIDEIKSACPDAVVIVAELTPNKNAAAEAREKVFNAAIPAIASARTHVLTVNMSDYVPASDLKDSVHPNDAGYQLMAEAWLTGIEKAVSEGWITPPI